MDGFQALAEKPFRFGPREISLADIYPASALDRLPKKFKVEPVRLVIALRELARHLYLAAHSPRPVFFPGDQLIDDLWHAMIIETSDYRLFCDRLRPGCFIDHSGVPFETYVSGLTNKQIHEEQCSWLASYIANFGPMDEDAYQCLLLAQSLAERLNGDLKMVNLLGDEILKAIEMPVESEFNFEEFLRNEVAPRANDIDSSPSLLSAALRTVAKIQPFTNVHLEKLFGESLALGFAFWQHLAVVERLEGLPDWQSRQPELWQALQSGRVLCGLATTHLANPRGASIQGMETVSGFLLNGNAAWVCGKGIFDKLLVGFESGEAIHFAICDFPTGPCSSTSFQQMSCLMGAATVQIKLDNYVVSRADLVSSRLKSYAPPLPRVTQYRLPELGIAKSAAQRVRDLVHGSDHPKHKIVAQNLMALESRISQLTKKRDRDIPIDELIVERDEINRDAVRLLALTLGGFAMAKESGVPRLQLELLLMDSVIQSPAVLESKISSTARG